MTVRRRRLSGMDEMELDGDEIDVGKLAEMRARGDAHTLLDVREPNEIAICVLEDSLSIPMQQVPQQIASLSHDHPLIVLCHHGTRSAMVTAFLRENGFDNVLNLTGGIDAWACLVEPDMARY